MTDNLDRILPENQEAELALLGAIFAGPDGLEKARKIIKSEDFTRIVGRKIFACACEFADAGRPFNITAIDQSFEDDQNYYTYSDTLTELDTITTTVVTYYAKIVRENSLRRKLIAVTEYANRDCFSQAVSLTEITTNLALVCAEIKAGLETAE